MPASVAALAKFLEPADLRAPPGANASGAWATHRYESFATTGAGYDVLAAYLSPESRL